MGVQLDRWDAFFIPLLSIGVPANIFCIIFTLKFHKKFFGIGLFIVNLALSDLLLHVTAFYFKYNRKFNLSGVYSCKIITIMDMTALHNSCFTLTIVAFCRLLILRGSPLFSNSTLSRFQASEKFRNDALICAGCWFVSVTMTLPFGLSMTASAENCNCHSTFSDKTHRLYSIFVFCSTWLVPGVLTSILYGIILYYIVKISSRQKQNQQGTRGAPSPNSSALPNTSHSAVAHGRNLNLFKFLSMVTLTYWLLHIPFWFSYISRSFGLDLVPDNFHMWAIALTYVNAAIDPFLYTLLTRKKALKVLCCFLKFMFCTVYCELMYLVLCSDAYDDQNSFVMVGSDVSDSETSRGAQTKHHPQPDQPLAGISSAKNDLWTVEPTPGCSKFDGIGWEDDGESDADDVVVTKRRKMYSSVVPPNSELLQKQVKKESLQKPVKKESLQKPVKKESLQKPVKKVSLQMTGSLPVNMSEKRSKKISLQFVITSPMECSTLNAANGPLTMTSNL